MKLTNCFACGKNFVSAIILSEHLQIHFPEMKFEAIKGLHLRKKETNACENCKSKEKGDNVTEKCYKCRKIGIKKMAEKIRIDSGKNLKQRNFSVTNNNGGSNWTCLKCKKKFKQVAKLMFHKKTCSLAKPGKALLCKMCQKIFVSKSTLQRHVQVTHLPLKNSEEANRKFKCCHCKKNIREKELPNDFCKKCKKIFTPKVDIIRSVLKPNLRLEALRLSKLD